MAALLALGANIFNMAVIGVFVSYAVYTLLQRALGGKRWGLYVSGFAAAWLSIVIASLACALELALSGTSPANIAVPAMGAIHALIGLGEGLITVGALGLIEATRPDLLNSEKKSTGSEKVMIFGGIAIAVALAVLSPLASSHPDGLEWVAEQHGFIDAARDAVYNIIPDYTMPGISNTALATIVAAILGVMIVFFVAYGIARG